MNVGIVLAGGKSQRMGGGVDKAFVTLGAKPVLAHSLQAFEDCEDIDQVILVARRDRMEPAAAMIQVFGFSKVKNIVMGGSTRQKSVCNGLTEVSESAVIVAVHDGARPCVTPELISRTVQTAKRYGSGVAAAKITDTVKEVGRGSVVVKSLDRTRLWAMQTPQTFRVKWLREAFANMAKKGSKVTDEASAIELLGKDVRLVPSTWANIKITALDDIPLALVLLNR